MTKKRKIVIIVLGVILIVLAGVLGVTLALKGRSKTKIINGIVVPIKADVSYGAMMITSQEEYLQILEDNNVNVNEETLEEIDLEKNDYIVDYISYDDKLEITGNINVEILDGGVIITYPLNHEVETNNQMLLYFIPLDKGTLKDFYLANRVFNYDK